MTPFGIEFAAEARLHALEIAAWWIVNRADASHLFASELDVACFRLSMTPRAGSVYRAKRSGAYRRLLLPKTQHHLYYTVDETRRVVIIHAIWHTARGRRPGLP